MYNIVCFCIVYKISRKNSRVLHVYTLYVQCALYAPVFVLMLTGRLARVDPQLQVETRVKGGVKSGPDKLHKNTLMGRRQKISLRFSI